MTKISKHTNIQQTDERRDGGINNIKKNSVEDSVAHTGICQYYIRVKIHVKNDKVIWLWYVVHGQLENVFVKHYAPNYTLSLKHALTAILKHQKWLSSKVEKW